MSIGKNIKTFRKIKGMTQSELAEQLGVTMQAVSKWETGNGMPDVSMIVPLAKIFNVTADKLLENGNRYKEVNKGFYDILRNYGDMSNEMREYVKKAAEEFPTDETFVFRHIMNELSEAQRMEERGEDAGRQYGVTYDLCREYDRKFPGTEDVVLTKIKCLVKMGMRDEAISLAHKSCDKDRNLKFCLEGDDLIGHRQRLIEKKFGELIREMVWSNHASLNAAEALIKTAIPDGNYMVYNTWLRIIAQRRLQLYVDTGDLDSAIKVLEDNCELVENDDRDRFTCPMFDHIIFESYFPSVNHPMELSVPQGKYDRALSKHLKYAEIKAKLLERYGDKKGASKKELLFVSDCLGTDLAPESDKYICLDGTYALNVPIDTKLHRQEFIERCRETVRQVGRPVVIFSAGAPDQFGSCWGDAEESALMLYMTDEAYAKRIENRGLSEDHRERLILQNRWFREKCGELYPKAERLDITGLSQNEARSRIDAWIKGKI